MINLIVIPQNQKLADLSQNLKVATKTFHSVVFKNLSMKFSNYGSMCLVPVDITNVTGVFSWKSAILGGQVVTSRQLWLANFNKKQMFRVISCQTVK